MTYWRILKIIKKHNFISTNMIYSIIDFTLLYYHQDKKNLEIFYTYIIKFLEKNNFPFKQIDGLNCYCIKETSEMNVEKNSN